MKTFIIFVIFSTIALSRAEEDIFSCFKHGSADLNGIKFKLDFRTQPIEGQIHQKIKVNSDHVLFDIDPSSVYVNDVEMDGKKLKYEIEKHPLLEQHKCLRVDFSGAKGESLKINYQVVKSKANGFTDMETVTGKPFSMSDFESIKARSMLVTADSPSVKQPYEATIISPQPNYFVKMSAESTSSDKQTFKFSQPIPVPAYLIALVMTSQENVQVLPKNSATIPVSNKEDAPALYVEYDRSSELFKKIKEMERYTAYPYVWSAGQSFNILVMPKTQQRGFKSSYLQQGMENPLLTIVSPEIFENSSQDQSTPILLHEIAHSWFGNLITCKTWNDFWLNEAFATFLERKISGEKANRDIMQGKKQLEHDVQLSNQNAYTALYIDYPSLIKERNANVDRSKMPDEAQLSMIPYEKGFQLLAFLEQKLGASEFQNRLNEYVKKFAYGSVSTKEFIEIFHAESVNLEQLVKEQGPNNI